MARLHNRSYWINRQCTASERRLRMTTAADDHGDVLGAASAVDDSAAIDNHIDDFSDS